MNFVVLLGRLTKDPELRRTNDGTAVVSFSLAVNRPHSREKEVDFIDCVAWRNTAEFIAQYLTKGRQIALTGEMRVRDWTAKDGTKRRSVEVIADTVEFADSKPKAEPPIIEDDDELPWID